MERRQYVKTKLRGGSGAQTNRKRNQRKIKKSRIRLFITQARTPEQVLHVKCIGFILIEIY